MHKLFFRIVVFLGEEITLLEHMRYKGDSVICAISIVFLAFASEVLVSCRALVMTSDDRG